ncbi:hypothetical protein Vadar_029733 [Vaccinium darrowii]|uniref:Uncharacterized protein n=1 Tax=Vaccinium darrowii TaxID=229202 RepID=A0ACB7Z0F4_9ERIC|nr:hypothetical protein Vadar_029733 [Vaccinium darrowii]
MYPSYNNGNYSYPLDQTLPYTQEEDHHPTPNPPPSSLFYNFPSPCIPYEDGILLHQHLHDLLLQHPGPQVAEASDPPEMTDSVNNNTQCQSANESVVPRKKSSKKDRHSKIETAQGPRDRRMRLSLEVAPQFFGLQDMLGFDKASKTVGWLLGKSKNAIKELKRGVSNSPLSTKSASSNSEGEEASGVEESPDRQVIKRSGSTKGKGLVSVAKEKKVNRTVRKSAFDALAKESREKARARARERTREKRSSRVQLNEPNLPNSQEINQEVNTLGSWNAFEHSNEEPSSSFNVFNCDQHYSTGIPQENQFADYQGYGKPWETYNNINPF